MKVCKKCKAALINNQWIPTKNIQDGYIYVLCPECEKEDIAEYQASLMSMVILDAHAINGNEKAAMRQIYAVEKQFQTTGIAGKIVSINWKSDQVIIKTSHPLLAAQIGKKFHKLYRGTLTFNPKGARGVLVLWIGNTSINKPVDLNPVLHQVAA